MGEIRFLHADGVFKSVALRLRFLKAVFCAGGDIPAVLSDVCAGIAPNAEISGRLSDALSQLRNAYEEIRDISGVAEDGLSVSDYASAWKTTRIERARRPLRKFLSLSCPPNKPTFADALEKEKAKAENMLHSDDIQYDAVEAYRVFVERVEDDAVSDEVLDCLERKGFSQTLTGGLRGRIHSGFAPFRCALFCRYSSVSAFEYSF